MMYLGNVFLHKWGSLLDYMYPVIEYGSYSILVWSKQFLMDYKTYN